MSKNKHVCSACLMPISANERFRGDETEHRTAARCIAVLRQHLVGLESALADLLLVVDTSPGIEATAKAVAEARRLTAK